MDPEEQRKQIEATVIDILKHGDMEEMTEFKVRLMAAVRLGIDLSDVEHKKFIRGVLESFLVSSREAEAAGDASAAVADETREEERVPKREVDGNRNRIICKLSNKRNVVVQGFSGKSFVNIREFHNKDSKQVPSYKGICLTAEQWSVLRNNVPAIEEAVKKMQSKLSSDRSGRQNEQLPETVTASASPRELVHVEINRFDGKNYRQWATEMEVFLKQLNIAYVLADPRPDASLSLNASGDEIAYAKAAERKWCNDDYLCRHNILHSLSDSLYNEYLKKTKSAKELWEELKAVYHNEEFERKRAQVKKYIEYQMVDDKSVVNQIIELNHIADAIIASGMFIEENFHVSAIISKLPPSWKDVCIKLMRMEYLPFWSLMENVRLEEESRKQEMQGEPLPSASMHSHHANNIRPMVKEMNKPVFHWKRQEAEPGNKSLICNSCGKRGHKSRHCHNKRLKGENNGRLEKNSSTPAVSGINIEQGRDTS